MTYTVPHAALCLFDDIKNVFGSDIRKLMLKIFQHRAVQQGHYV